MDLPIVSHSPHGLATNQGNLGAVMHACSAMGNIPAAILRRAQMQMSVDPEVPWVEMCLPGVSTPCRSWKWGFSKKASGWGRRSSDDEVIGGSVVEEELEAVADVDGHFLGREDGGHVREVCSGDEDDGLCGLEGWK